jgi:hypothetical protein
LKIKTLAILCILFPVLASAWELPLIEGVKSAYTEPLKVHLSAGADEYKEKAKALSDNILLYCFSDSGNDLYIGAAQYMTIGAPISTVERVLRNFDDYSKLFDGLVASSAEKNGEEKFQLSTEQYVPVPLVSNIRTRMQYQIEKENGRTLFRYQLVKSNNLKFYDGFILLTPGKDQTTEFIEYDFWSADWGMAKMLGKESIWIDSLSAMYQTDVAIKMRAENKSLSDKEVLKASTATAKKQNFKECFKDRTPFFKK